MTGEVINGWCLSSDIGCAFIPLDGMTHAYRITRDEALAVVIQEAITAFAESDLMAATFQTHATLSAVRGILRFYEDTSEAPLLSLALRTYDYYLTHGMTENFANHNWFGRPDWTEPCAVVDSFMVGMQLFALTGEIRYLQAAERIYYNGLCYGQRPNGGFGCDICAGTNLHPNGEGAFEAVWCCTMRGGEGLSRVAQYASGYDTETNTVYLNLLMPGEYRLEQLHFIVETDYPHAGEVIIRVLENPSGASLKAYAPYSLTSGDREEAFVTLPTPSAGSVLAYRMALPFHAQPARFTPGKFAYWYGPMLLGRISGCGTPDGLMTKDGYRFVDANDGEYLPLDQFTFMSRESVLKTDIQLLF